MVTPSQNSSPSSPQQPRVLILGSCVSRDIFRINKESPLVLADFYARSSFASAFHPIVVQDEWSANLSSPFQRSVVHADLCKKWPDIIRSTQYDLILVDFTDERLNIAQLPNNGIVTLSKELASAGFDEKKSSTRFIPFALDEHYKLWEAGWSNFINLLKQQKKLQCLCLNKIYWASSLQGGKSAEWGLTSTKIDMANAYFDTFLYRRALEDIPAARVLDFDRELFVGDEKHYWGQAPFHYIEEYYHEALKMLNRIAHIS